MNTLCIDTSSSVIAITAVGNLGEFTLIHKPVSTRHSALLISLMESAVKSAGFSIEETEIVVCPQGPGSFTGLRLAYSTAKALCLKTNARFFCIPILDAFNFRYGNGCGQFLAIIDAKRNRFYTRLFNNLKPVCEPADISAAEAVKLLDLTNPAIICGFGTEQFKKDIAGFQNINNVVAVEEKPEILSHIMLDCVKANKNLIEVRDYDGPLYIRKSDAEE